MELAVKAPSILQKGEAPEHERNGMLLAQSKPQSERCRQVEASNKESEGDIGA